MNRIITLGMTLALATGGALAGPRDGWGRAFQEGGDLDAPAGMLEALGRGHGGPRAIFRGLFARVDANDDGAISLEEFTAQPLARVARRFDHLDADASGGISREEFDSRANGRHFRDWIDRDALRACMAEHLDEELPAAPDPDQLFADLDADDDGQISAAEMTASLTARLTARFGVVDADDDNAIAAEELAAAFQQARERRLVHRLCVEEQRDIEDFFED
jgi:Ca2+-binding EF-hand superfamily protein